MHYSMRCTVSIQYTIHCIVYSILYRLNTCLNLVQFTLDVRQDSIVGYNFSLTDFQSRNRSINWACETSSCQLWYHFLRSNAHISIWLCSSIQLTVSSTLTGKFTVSVAFNPYVISSCEWVACFISWFWINFHLNLPFMSICFNSSDEHEDIFQRRWWQYWPQCCLIPYQFPFVRLQIQ